MSSAEIATKRRFTFRPGESGGSWAVQARKKLVDERDHWSGVATRWRLTADLSDYPYTNHEATCAIVGDYGAGPNYARMQYRQQAAAW
jgi:hypothetical protein